jgi:biotin-dependent carboxylase-like uncharacterized protein
MADALRVLSPGMLTTVQDLGRFGYAHLGISASGHADNISARLSNRLVGNQDNAPVLEMTLLGGHFEFGSDSSFALAGAAFAAALDGSPVRAYEPVSARAGAVLRCGSARKGARCYLAVAGGFEVPPVLGSTSTHVMSSIGGLSGRPLKRGDVLPIRSPGAAHLRKINPSALQKLGPRSTLRVTLGPQHEMFGEDGIQRLCSQAFRVSEDSNRVGVRLQSEAIKPIHDLNMPTEGAALGAIQIPPGGEPIVLFVEHQTTGGYPKIANIITADLPSVGQLRPRDEIRFEWVRMQHAIELLKEQEANLEAAVA